MYEILNKIDVIPLEIMYEIISYVPFVELTNNILQLQRKRMRIYKCIKRYLYIDDKSLRKDIFQNYNGDDQYVFENDEHFVFIRICFLKETLEDYFALSFN